MSKEKAAENDNRFDEYTRGAWHIIRIHQLSDANTDMSWLKKVVENACAKESRLIALAFERHTYLYSKIISAIVACSKIVDKCDGSLALIEPGRHILVTLQLMKLFDTVIRVFETEEDLITGKKMTL